MEGKSADKAVKSQQLSTRQCAPLFLPLDGAVGYAYDWTASHKNGNSEPNAAHY